MQALKAQLENITKTLSSLSSTDIALLEDAKSLKSVVFVVDRVLDILENEVGRLQQLKLRSLAKLSTKLETIKPQLEAAEAKFLIKYQQKEIIERPITKPQIIIDIAGLLFTSLLYNSKMDIPILGYGAIMLRSQPQMVFRYSENDFVSVSAIFVTEYSQDNTHTICCGNGLSCEYGDDCRYYHDPMEWPDSQHQQRFSRTNMVKKCPMFGHSENFVDQANQLTFENLRTLARYCAVQTLLIHIVAARFR